MVKVHDGRSTLQSNRHAWNQIRSFPSKKNFPHNLPITRIVSYYLLSVANISEITVKTFAKTHGLWQYNGILCHKNLMLQVQVHVHVHVHVPH